MMGNSEPVDPSPVLHGDSDSNSFADNVVLAVHCSHARTKSVRTFSGNFVIMRIVCEECGRIVQDENVLLGLERLRCPVDPRLDRCLMSCPVEEGSLGVFENPCGPVRNAIEGTGFVVPGVSRLPEPDATEK